MISCWVLWWSMVSGSSDRGNVSAFQNIGVNAQLVSQELNPNFHLSQGADFIFTSMYPQMIAWEQANLLRLPSVIQMGGYGLHFLPKGKVDRNIGKVTEIPNSIITVLDPKMLWEMKESKEEFCCEKMFVVPNGSSASLRNFPDMKVEKDPNNFVVFNPMGNFWIKEPERFIECVKKVNEFGLPIKFVFPIKTMHSYNCPIEWLDVPNLELLPMQNLMEMYKWYLRCDVVASFSQAEIMPTTIFEAFRFGKPLVHNNPSLIQTIPIDLLGECIKDFGMNLLDFDDAWKEQYYQGRHLLVPKDEKEFADMILFLYDEEMERKTLGDNAQNWFAKFYTMEDKCLKIMDMLKERKLVV